MKLTTKKQKIGASKGARRICLWSLELNRIGLTSGTPLMVYPCPFKEQSGQPALVIRPCVEGEESRRKVSRVINHGKELPVVDLKETKSLSLELLGEIGDKVQVEFCPPRPHSSGYVFITPAS